MSIVLRPYQEDCLDAIIQAIPQDENILVMAATGAGKTIIFSSLCQCLLTQWPKIRIAILAHRRELIQQAKDKLVKVWPEAIRIIGIACASVGSKVDVDRPITIGSIQTLINQVENTAPFDLIIIDEAHKLPPINVKSQYSKFLHTMKRYNPRVRILGVTATPFRLGHGYCYGQVCKDGNENLFPHLHYRIGIRELQEQGFLCQYRAKEAVNISNDLKTVKVSGDYNVGELAEVMSRKYLVESAVKAYREHASDRRHVIVFAVTIEHAEILRDAFRAADYTAEALHSKMATVQRDLVLKCFESGQVQFIVNVGVLTEGFDSPQIDCIIMCRPTKSPGLYVQMCGRGLRPYPGKEDVLILDLANNCTAHGDPDSPSVTIPGRSGGGCEPPLKACPKCFEIHHASARVCKVCAYEWPVEVVTNNGDAKMQDVKWGKRAKVEAVKVQIGDAAIDAYESRAGNYMLRLSMKCYIPGVLAPLMVNHFFDFEGQASEWGQRRAKAIWKLITGTEPPKTVDEADDRQGELFMSLPEEIEVVEKGKYWNVHRWVLPEQVKEAVNG